MKQFSKCSELNTGYCSSNRAAKGFYCATDSIVDLSVFAREGGGLCIEWALFFLPVFHSIRISIG